MPNPDWNGKKYEPSPKKRFNEWSTGWIIFIVIFGALMLFSAIWSETPEGKRSLENSDRIRFSEEWERKKANMLFKAEREAQQERWKHERR